MGSHHCGPCIAVLLCPLDSEYRQGWTGKAQSNAITLLNLRRCVYRLIVQQRFVRLDRDGLQMIP
jgi:hypothetical protein